MVDKNGSKIVKGQTVVVPAGQNGDLWGEWEFTATVASVLDTVVSVVDYEGDFWDVDADRLEVLE